MPKLVRITTVPISLQVLLKGQMRHMQSKGFEVTMISSAGPEIPDLLEQEGCPHIVVEMTRKITPWKDLKALIRLTRILRKIKPDIVHTHTPKAGLIGMWAAKFAGVPVRLHTIAGLPWMETKGLLRKILWFVEKLTAMAACQIMPNSFVQQKFLYDQHIARNKMKVLGKGSTNGINTQHFSADESCLQKAALLKAEAMLPEDAWIWIFVGRIVKDKGIMELMDAFNQLHGLYPNDRLWLLGDEEPELDPLETKYSDWLRQHPAMKWWGYQKDIRPYLASAQVLTFPSYREGFPNVPLQAGSMGCFLILSDINGCNEIVEDGKDGLLVPVKNREKLFEAMHKLRSGVVDHASLCKRMKEKITQNFDQQSIWGLLSEEYRHWIKKTTQS